MYDLVQVADVITPACHDSWDGIYFYSLLGLHKVQDKCAIYQASANEPQSLLFQNDIPSSKRTPRP
jgi:hypothetical protein